MEWDELQGLSSPKHPMILWLLCSVFRQKNKVLGLFAGKQELVRAERVWDGFKGSCLPRCHGWRMGIARVQLRWLRSR